MAFPCANAENICRECVLILKLESTVTIGSGGFAEMRFSSSHDHMTWRHFEFNIRRLKSKLVFQLVVFSMRAFKILNTRTDIYHHHRVVKLVVSGGRPSWGCIVGPNTAQRVPRLPPDAQGKSAHYCIGATMAEVAS